MRAHSVVVSPPSFDDDLCLLERIEDFPVKQFITEFGIEAFAIAVFPRAARHNVGRLGTGKRKPQQISFIACNLQECKSSRK